MDFLGPNKTFETELVDSQRVRAGFAVQLPSTLAAYEYVHDRPDL